jgi:hypothetical protein
MRADGRYVAFQATATNLVTGDTNGAVDAFVRDRTAGTTVRVSLHDNDTQSSTGGWHPWISDSGTRVVFTSNSKLSGIDPLTVEQTMLIEHPPGTENHPYYHAVVDKLKPREAIVFEDGAGKPWSLKAKAYDVSVFFPVDEIRVDRPTWADLGGLRRAYSINGTLCQGQFPCLVEARYVGEGNDAIPADRLVLDPMRGSENPDERLFHNVVEVRGLLYLRPGRYRLVSLGAEGRVIARTEATISDASGKRP